MASEEKLRRRVKTLGRKFPALVGGSVLLVYAAKALNDEYLRKPESQGGPRLTNQPSRGGEGNGGTRVEAKPGADEQNKFRWPWDDDDDFTGGSGASDEEPVHLGGVEPDWDAERMIAFGGVAFIVTALVIGGVVWGLTRNSGSNSQHAPAY